MSIRDYKITDAQFSEKGVIAAPDTLTGTAAENKGVSTVSRARSSDRSSTPSLTISRTWRSQRTAGPPRKRGACSRRTPGRALSRGV